MSQDTPSLSELEIAWQHIEWLKIYTSEMKPENWRDMRLHIERQLDKLSDTLSRLSGNGGGWKCSARNSTQPEPTDCNWPVCGCDPYAGKVIEALQESGLLGAATPSALLEEDLAEALVIIAGHGIEPDVQELLVYGNPSRGIKRGALAAVIRAFKAQAASERLSPPNLEPQCGVGEDDKL